MSVDVHRTALAELLAAYAKGPREGAELGAALAERKDLKDSFAQIAKVLKYRDAQHLIIQRCFEADPDHPLHQAARALAAADALPGTPWVSIASAGQPKRWIIGLALSRREPAVYAREIDSRVSLWSTERGEHLVDLALPGGKKDVAVVLHETDEGVLRCLTRSGHLLARGPGEKAFTKLLEVGNTRHAWAACPELRWLINQIDFQPVEEGGAAAQRVGLHDAVSRTSREVRVPINYPEGKFHWVPLEGGRFLIGGRRSRDDDTEVHSLSLLDPVTGAVTTLPLVGEIQDLALGTRPNTVRLSLVTRDAEGEEVDTREVEYDLATRTESLVAETEAEDEERDDRTLQLDGGLRFDAYTGRFLDGEDRITAAYLLADDPYTKVAAWDAARQSVVYAGGDPPTALVVLRRYDPDAVKAAPVAPAAEPLPWTHPGAMLTYALSDFDASDTYTFEVLDSDPGLTLQIRMDDQLVAAHARFSVQALERADRPVALAQGGADVDLSQEQTKVVPPIMLSRASAAALRAGRDLTWKSEWTGTTTLSGASPELVRVRVDEVERPVAARTARNDDVILTFLDDPQWPLVLSRAEGDCFLRLETIELPRSARGAVTPARSPSAPEVDAEIKKVAKKVAKKASDAVAAAEVSATLAAKKASAKKAVKAVARANAAPAANEPPVAKKTAAKKAASQKTAAAKKTATPSPKVSAKKTTAKAGAKKTAARR